MVVSEKVNYFKMCVCGKIFLEIIGPIKKYLIFIKLMINKIQNEFFSVTIATNAITSTRLPGVFHYTFLRHDYLAFVTT